MLIGLRSLSTFFLLSFLSQETTLRTNISHVQLCVANVSGTLFSWHWLVILVHLGHLTLQLSWFQLCSDSFLSSRWHSGMRWTCAGPGSNHGSAPSAVPLQACLALLPTSRTMLGDYEAELNLGTKECMQNHMEDSNQRLLLYNCLFLNVLLPYVMI